ncbi:shikimate kinase [Tepidibacillus marianensis]|uniref:shikimate kinase n=1 Tax=Tepidibacillus marianensis TaxID=3131995 RepID=UPI0030CC831B
MTKLEQHIILIGFMGVGKSTVGKELANILNIPFIDMDEEIIKQEGRTIPDIFKLAGEKYFRKIETMILQRIIQSPNQAVIATGGGIILSKQNRLLIKQHYTILLDASIDEVYRRVSGNSEDRPLLQSNQDLRRRLEDLYRSRSSLYQELADVIIDTEKRISRRLLKK